MLLRIYLPLVLCLLCNVAVGDEDSIGPDGIRSSQLDLHGSGIAIGQVEATRPGVADFDDFFFHDDIVPTTMATLLLLLVALGYRLRRR